MATGKCWHYTHEVNENRSTHPTQRCDGISQGSCQVQGPSLPLSLDPSFLATRKNKTLHRWLFLAFFQSFLISKAGWVFGMLAAHFSVTTPPASTSIQACALAQGNARKSNKETCHLRPQSGHRSPQRTWGTLCSFTKFKIRFINVNCTTPEAKYILRT